MPIDWSLAQQQPNFVGNALQSFQTGQKDARDQGERNALQRFATDPDGAVNAEAGYDPVKADQLRQIQQAQVQRKARTTAAGQLASGDTAGATNTALGAGDVETAKLISTLTKEQRAQATQHAQDFGQFVYGLGKVPYDQRKGIIAQNKPTLIARGFKPEEVDSFDPTDDNIAMATSAATTLKDQLASDHQQAVLGETVRHNQADEAHATDTQAETVRHNKVDEGQGVAKIGLEGQRVDIERQKADKAAAGRQAPPTVKAAYAANASKIAQIDDATAAINAYPKAVGLDMALGENWNQRTDPKGIAARAAIANIGSLIIHDRSGAAVTVSESPRLMPFIPRVTDGPDAVRTKLAGLKQQISNMNAEIETNYGEDNGYAPLRTSSRGEGGAAGGVGSSARSAEPPAAAQKANDGRYYVPDPGKPGSFPETRKAPDGHWYFKSADGSYYRVK